VLSHDCDVLYGNDRWTQVIRLYRIPAAPLQGKLPPVGNLWWALRNAATPGRFYFNNVIGMIDLERCFGHRSTFYLLNGSGGRFGARNGSRPLSKLKDVIPARWDIGMHYNYDTLLDEERFLAQQRQLADVLGYPPSAGRAHYLRFDPEKSLPFLERFGIRVDESSGYPDLIGYRNGVAGAFEPYDSRTGDHHTITEVPMVIMDAVMVRQYGDRWRQRFIEMLHHLSRVGGALSIVFHPGVFFNPELKSMMGVYHRMLIEARRFGTTSMTAAELAGVTAGHPA
jgi:hypothetical protein